MYSSVVAYNRDVAIHSEKKLGEARESIERTVILYDRDKSLPHTEPRATDSPTL